jgi:hypothetical protein
MQANFMIYFIIVIINFYLQSPAVLVINSSATDNTVDPNHITSVANKEDLTVKKYQEYIPSIVENYLRDNLDYLGYNTITSNPSGCKIWQDQTATTPAIHSLLASYSADLKNYTGIVKKFKQIPDLLKIIQKTNSHDICVTARPHPHGIKALFPSNQLSLSDSGYVEPLTTPMRHHDICTEGSRLMTLEYLVHDFEAMCRKLKPTSKRILIDMGASLSFHGEETKSPQPIVELLNLYKKFGFKFDHIYGFEVTFTDPKEVYENLLPEEYLPNYHWINVGKRMPNILFSHSSTRMRSNKTWLLLYTLLFTLYSAML